MSFSDIFNRVKNLTINPIHEWEIIEAEDKDKNQLVKEYAFPFMVLIAVCSFIGASIFTLQLHSFSYIILKTILSAILVIGGVYLSSIIINELTVSFGTEKNLNGTFKLVIYSFTSYFLASCLVGLLPDFPILGIFGLHSIYLFWLGTTPILKTPDVNKAGFVIVSLLIIIGIYAILSLIIGSIMAGISYVTQPIQ
jgi:hypothetical protein